jgi:hypothetical protein
VTDAVPKLIGIDPTACGSCTAASTALSIVRQRRCPIGITSTAQRRSPGRVDVGTQDYIANANTALNCRQFNSCRSIDRSLDRRESPNKRLSNNHNFPSVPFSSPAQPVRTAGNTTKFRSLGTYGSYTSETPTGTRRPSFSTGTARRPVVSNKTPAEPTSQNIRPSIVFFHSVSLWIDNEGAINGSLQPLDDDTALPSSFCDREQANGSGPNNPTVPQSYKSSRAGNPAPYLGIKMKLGQRLSCLTI